MMWWSSLSLCAWPLQSQGEARPKKYNGAGPAAKPQALSACFAFCRCLCAGLYRPTQLSPHALQTTAKATRRRSPCGAWQTCLCLPPCACARDTHTVRARQHAKNRRESASCFSFPCFSSFPPFCFNTHLCAQPAYASCVSHTRNTPTTSSTTPRPSFFPNTHASPPSNNDFGFPAAFPSHLPLLMQERVLRSSRNTSRTRTIASNGKR